MQVVEVILGIPDIVFMWGSKTKGLFILMIFDIVFKLQQLKPQRKRERLEKYSGMCAHTHSHIQKFQSSSTLSTQRLVFGVIEQLKYTSCQARRLIKSQAKLAGGWLTTISETSIFREAVQFLLIACKARRENLKNDCPRAEISPYRRQHLEDTHHSCWNLIILNAFL